MSKFLSSKYLLRSNKVSLLILICIFFLFTRFYKISEIPPSVYWDEASIGYNAYSIVQTGKDEWGDSFPLHFRAFGEFKLPIFIYATVLSVKIFGLNEFSVRFPSVIFSLATVIITFFLAKKISGQEWIGLTSSFFVTVLPWFFIFSRTGYEATAGLTFYLLAIYLFLLLPKSNLFLPLSILTFILSAYSYNSFRLISPLTIIVLAIFERKDLVKRIKENFTILALIIILLALSIWPIYRLYSKDVGGFRLRVVGSHPNTFLSSYFSHFHPAFLFTEGDRNVRSQQMGFGQLYLFNGLFIVFGLIYIGRKSKYGLLIILLTLIAPIPAAITKESPHALRSISIVPFISILSAFGAFYIKQFLRKKYLWEIGIITTTLILFANYFINFINIYPAYSLNNWQYGYKRIYLDFKDQFSKYSKVIISDGYAQPYIFALFYLKYNPEKFQREVIRNDVSNWGFSTVSKFDKFEFGKVNKIIEMNKPANSLIFASEEDKIPNVEPKTTVKFEDNTIAFWVYEYE